MSKRVLIVEDDRALRDSIVQTLDLEGLEPIATGSFTQARRSIRASFRGVILSDIQMPDHDGFDVLRFAQSRDADLPVVLLTGHSDVATAMRAMKSGAYDYLEKPCNPDRLLDVLHRALQHRALVLQNRAIQAQLDASGVLDEDASLAEQLEACERDIIARALKAEKGKVSRAAKRLNVPRNTLYDRMNRLQLAASDYR